MTALVGRMVSLPAIPGAVEQRLTGSVTVYHCIVPMPRRVTISGEPGLIAFDEPMAALSAVPS